jgi:flagellar biosynthesis/type III secretory pathway protein FliH
MQYILEINDYVEPEELQGLLERDLGPEAKDAIMTAGQRLIEQGRQQGIEQGRQQGIEQGRQQGMQGVLLRLLRQRFGDAVNAQVEQHVAAASLEQVETWTGRVLSAATLAEVIAD